MSREKIFSIQTIFLVFLIVIIGAGVYGVVKLNDPENSTAVNPVENTHSHTFNFGKEPTSTWLGTHTGLFEHSDGEWTPTMGNLANMDVMGLEIDSDNPSSVFIGGHGFIMKSTDGGENWATLSEGLPNTPDAHIMHMDVNDPQHVYAFIAGERSSLYETKDGGVTWELLMDVPNNTISISTVKNNSNVLLIATEQNLLQYELSSESKEPVVLLDEMVYAVASMPNGDVMVIDSDGGSRRTRDLKQWSDLSLDLGGEFPLGIRFLSDGRGLVVTSNLTLYETKDHGETWSVKV